MTERAEILSRLISCGVVAVARTDDASRLIETAAALKAGGVEAFEVTMTVPGALDVIREVSRRLASEVLLGAGTVLDADTARAAIEAGARFIVSPCFSPGLITVAHQYDKVAVPGALTPTEIMNAHEAGADIVKVFPIRSLGPHYLRDVLAPFPQVRLMPTGGVDLENAPDFIRAGAVAVGVGSALVDGKLVAEGRFEELTERARRLVESIRRVRAGQEAT